MFAVFDPQFLVHALAPGAVPVPATMHHIVDAATMRACHGLIILTLTKINFTMIKEKNRSFEEISRLKKFTVKTGIFVLLFGGMFAAIVAIYNFKNYDNPYLFGFTFGTIGLLTGLFIAKKIKSKILISQQMQQNYFQLTMYVAIGFIGLALLLGQKSNTLLSSKKNATIIS